MTHYWVLSLYAGCLEQGNFSIYFNSGKRAEEYRPTEETVDARSEELQELIQVCGEESSRVP
jgi:hypothetical protein